MQRNGIVDHRADPGRAEVRAEPVAVARPDDVLMKDVPLAGGRGRDQRRVAPPGEPRRGEELAVPARDLPAGGVPGVELAELHAQHGRLERVETGAETERLVHVRRALALVALAPRVRRERVVVGEDHAAVAEPTQVLRRLEGEDAGASDGSGGGPV